MIQTILLWWWDKSCFVDARIHEPTKNTNLQGIFRRNCGQFRDICFEGRCASLMALACKGAHVARICYLQHQNFLLCAKNHRSCGNVEQQQLNIPLTSALFLHCEEVRAALWRPLCLVATLSTRSALQQMSPAAWTKGITLCELRCVPGREKNDTDMNKIWVYSLSVRRPHLSESSLKRKLS